MESLLLIVQSIGDFFQTIIDFFLNYSRLFRATNHFYQCLLH